MRGKPEFIQINRNGTIQTKEQRMEELSKQIVAAEFPPETTELMMAAAYGDIITTKKVFYNEINKVNSIGNTALIYACQSGRMEVAKFLMKYEDIRHRNKEGYSAVDLAFFARQADMCLFLEDYCIRNGFNDLKPKVRSTRQSEYQAAQKLYYEYELDAAEMFDYAENGKKNYKPGYFDIMLQDDVKQRNKCLKCGAAFKPNAKFCSECGAKK